MIGRTFWLVRAVTSFVALIISFALVPVALAKSEKSRVVFVMADIDPDDDLIIAGSRIVEETQTIKARGGHFFVHAAHSPFIWVRSGINMGDVVVAHKRIKIGRHVFVTAHGIGISACFDTGSIVFDVKPDTLNVVLVPNARTMSDPRHTIALQSDLSEDALRLLMANLGERNKKLSGPYHLAAVGTATFPVSEKEGVPAGCFVEGEAKVEIGPLP